MKDKLGTRKVPTAELELVNTPATPVVGTSDGVRAITPMLNSTRTWNAVNAVSFMRRGISLARDYARKRFAFGALLRDKPLHAESLADMQCEFEAAFHLTFRVCELLGADDHRALGTRGEHLLRVMTPLAKLLTGKHAVSIASETLECFGGAGVRRRHGPSDDPSRLSSAADLGGDHQRVVARHAQGPRQQQRPLRRSSKSSSVARRSLERAPRERARARRS